ncbi:MAG: type VII secretion protein EccE, partial [Mycobacteriaceae bacterium]|nr:type VII secretion protein EccE [Mycobacteriaceae bacterium]
DQERNLTTLSRRGGTDSAGPKAVASAAHRIAAQLRGAGISAQVLPAAAVRQAVRQLHAGIDPGELSESWTQLTGPVESRCVTNYWVDWSQLQEDGLDECFSAGGRRTTLTVSLSSKLEPDLVAPRRGIGDVEVRGLVRYVGPAFDQPPLAYLRALGGRQSEALLASLGSGVSCAAIGVEPIAAAEVLPAPGGQDSGLTIPIGPSGQLLGSISGRPHHMLALSLFDPTPYNPRRRTVEVRATLPVAQQIILRAAAVGADVEIHTGRPDSWHQFVAAVGDARTMRLAPPPGAPNGALPATIAVFDELNPSATGAHTTVTIVEPGVAPRGPQSDITITQVSQTTVTVSIPMSTVQVDLIEPVGEARYFDLAGRRQAAPATRPQSGRPGWRDLLDPDALSAGAAVPTAATATLPGNGRTASAGGAAGAESAGEPTSAPAPGTVFPGGA